jgi:hypothetical protein
MLSIPDSKEVQIKATLMFHLTVVRMATIKNTNATNVGEDVGKKNSYTLRVEM